MWDALDSALGRRGYSAAAGSGPLGENPDPPRCRKVMCGLGGRVIKRGETPWRRASDVAHPRRTAGVGRALACPSGPCLESRVPRAHVPAVHWNLDAPRRLGCAHSGCVEDAAQRLARMDLLEQHRPRAGAQGRQRCGSRPTACCEFPRRAALKPRSRAALSKARRWRIGGSGSGFDIADRLSIQG